MQDPFRGRFGGATGSVLHRTCHPPDGVRKRFAAFALRDPARMDPARKPRSDRDFSVAAPDTCVI